MYLHHLGHTGHSGCNAWEQRHKFLYLSCKCPLGHTLFPYVCLLCKLALLYKLLQLCPVIRTGLLTINRQHIAYHWLHTAHLRHTHRLHIAHTH